MAGKDKDDEYWINRRAEMMYEQMDIAESAADRISDQYYKVAKYIDQKLSDNFNRVVKNLGVSDKDILDIIKKSGSTSYQDIIRVAKNRGFTELVEYLEQPGRKYKYERMIQQLEETNNAIDSLKTTGEAETTAALSQIAESTYYKSIYDIQSRVGLAFSFSEWDSKLFENLALSNWSGKNYSKRIWDNTDALAETLKSELIQGFIAGKTQREMTKVIMNRFNAGAFDAKRLVRTEGCYIANEMQMQSYSECGVEKYRYVATLDLRTSKVCAALDGKIFNVKDGVPGVNMPPMHPFCRSTTIISLDEEALKRMQRRARNPITGKNEIVPAGMTYPEWYEKYVGKNSANDRLKIFTNNNKGSDRYYDFKGKSLETVENEIGKLDYEVSVAFDKSGKAVFCQVQEGTNHEVNYTKYQLSKMKDLDVTHNHPFNTPPSPEDLYLMVVNKAATIRTTGKEYTYIIKNTPSLLQLPPFEEFDKIYNEMYDLYMDEYHRKIKNGKISAVQAEILLQEDIWENLVKRYDINYTKIKNPK